ncbi:MAG TPA: hypothetical protein VH592_22065 [Gemmataceae bacterium]|jgi:tRNA-guanine family transglycosylase
MNQIITKRIQIGSRHVTTPLLWLGHDLKTRIRVWSQVRGCPGIVVNAHQVLSKRRFYVSACEHGLHAHLGYDGPLFLDSGGYQSQQTGRALIRVQELMAVQVKLRPDVGAVLDLPLDPLVSTRENARRWRRTLDNTAWMLRQKDRPLLALIVHSYNIQHAERRCLQLKALNEEPEVVCIGSLVPLLRGRALELGGSEEGHKTGLHHDWRYIARLISVVRTQFPRAMIHVFGAGTMASMFLLFLLGIDSVDSVAWRLKAAYGAIRLPGLADRYATDFGHTRTRRRLTSICNRLLRTCVCTVCEGLPLSRRVAKLAASFEARAVHNAQVFIDELNEFRLSARQRTHLDFVRHRLADNPLYLGIFNRTILPILSGGDA